MADNDDHLREAHEDFASESRSRPHVAFSSSTQQPRAEPTSPNSIAYRAQYGEDRHIVEIVCVDNLECVIKWMSLQWRGGLHDYDPTDPSERPVSRPLLANLDLTMNDFTQLNVVDEDDADDDFAVALDEVGDGLHGKVNYGRKTSRQLRDSRNLAIAKSLAACALGLSGSKRNIDVEQAEATNEAADGGEEYTGDPGIDVDAVDSSLQQGNESHDAEGNASASRSRDSKLAAAKKKEEARLAKKAARKRISLISKIGSNIGASLDRRMGLARKANTWQPIESEADLADLERRLEQRNDDIEEDPAAVAEDGGQSEVTRGASLERMIAKEAIETAAAKLYALCDIDGDGKVDKEELREKVIRNPELAHSLGIHLPSHQREGTELALDVAFEKDDAEAFNLFWKTHYHGYKAKDGQEGGLSQDDFITIVKKDRLTRAAASQLFRAIDVDRSGFVDKEEMLLALGENPELFGALFFDSPEDLLEDKRTERAERKKEKKKGSFAVLSKDKIESFNRWWDTADVDKGGTLDLVEFTRAYQSRDLSTFRWKPDPKKFKMSFKRSEPPEDKEDAFFAVNGFRGFDFAFVSPWPTNYQHAADLEALMEKLKLGGLDMYAYRSSTHGADTNKDAQVVIKVRAPLKRLRRHAAESGYRLLLSRQSLCSLAKLDPISMDDVTAVHEAHEGNEHTAHLYIAHDEDRVSIHPYEFIYAPYQNSQWWDSPTEGAHLFFCPGGLTHPFSSRNRIAILVDFMSEPAKYGGCEINLHAMDATLCNGFPLHRHSVLSQIDRLMNPSFIDRYTKFMRIRDRDNKKASSAHNSYCSSFIGFVRLIFNCTAGFFWFELSILWQIPVQQLRDYFGEKTALYFAFMGEYIRWQAMLAIPGAILSIHMLDKHNSETALAPWFAIMVGVWVELSTRNWRAYEYAFGCRYGIETQGTFLNMRDRPAFHGTLSRSVIDGSEITHYPWERRAARYIVSGLVITALVIIGAVFVVSILGLKLYMMHRKGRTHRWAESVCSALLGVYISVSNNFFRGVALKLTAWENHRTDTEFEDALVIKLFVMQFINSYATLYYVAFYKAVAEGCLNDDCVEDLHYRLVALLIARVSYKFLDKAIIPRMKIIYRRCRGLMRASSLDVEGDDVAQRQGNLNVYDAVMETTISYDELVIDLGYMVLFATAIPVAPLLMLPLTLLRKTSDASRLLFDFKRPTPTRVASIGMWNGVLSVLARITMVTNAGVVLVTMHGMEAYNRRSRNLVVAEVVAVAALVLLFVSSDPAAPFAIVVQKLREQFIVGRLLSMSNSYGDDAAGLRKAPSDAAMSSDMTEGLKRRKSLAGAAYHHYAV